MSWDAKPWVKICVYCFIETGRDVCPKCNQKAYAYVEADVWNQMQERRKGEKKCLVVG